jgi:sulfur carrier protein ThiS
MLIEESGLSVNDLLKKMNLSPQAYLVVRGKDLLTGREILKDGDEIRIIAVISGGSLT